MTSKMERQDALFALTFLLEVLIFYQWTLSLTSTSPNMQRLTFTGLEDLAVLVTWVLPSTSSLKMISSTFSKLRMSWTLRLSPFPRISIKICTQFEYCFKSNYLLKFYMYWCPSHHFISGFAHFSSVDKTDANEEAEQHLGVLESGHK